MEEGRNDIMLKKRDGEKMRNLIIVALILVGVVFSACGKKVDNSYERANQASEKALQGLDRD